MRLWVSGGNLVDDGRARQGKSAYSPRLKREFGESGFTKTLNRDDPIFRAEAGHSAVDLAPVDKAQENRTSRPARRVGAGRGRACAPVLLRETGFARRRDGRLRRHRTR